MIASVDVANGYNEIKHSSILQAVWDCPDLRGSYFFVHCILSQSSYTGTNNTNQATHCELLESNDGLAAGMDDTYIMGLSDATAAHDCTAKRDAFIPDLLIHNYP
eukprot:9256345-Ditylum_brightwellii.AAC.1